MSSDSSLPLHPPPPSISSTTPQNSSTELVGVTGNSRDQPPHPSRANATTPTLFSPSNLLSHPQQLYSPTQAELESHHVVQHYFPTQDDIVPTFDPALAESHRRQDSAAPAAMGETEIKEGDQVAWQWGGGKPGGEASEIKEHGELSITTKKGNEVKKNADPSDPAVKVSRSGNDVVKRAHELEITKKGDEHKNDGGEKKADDKEAEKEDDKEAKENGDAEAGDKRKADDEEEKEEETKAGAKKQKTGKAAKENGEKAEPKKKGRPAKATNGDKAKAEPKKKREPKKAATADGEPRRSGRNASK
ncbi:hypothetical protein LTR86_002264 [Recurvomyces mirabilis]|nr:hypothetical protein LTR86_002264 [Recurvomyces mirabilis]